MDEAKKTTEFYSFKEYLKLEEQTREKHDFYFGEVYSMAGGTIRHNQLVNRLLFVFNNHFSEKKCLVLTENVKLELSRDEFYVYPDMMLTCQPDDLADDKSSMVKKPVLIVEVLSEATELYDRNIKKKHSLELPSLKYYLLVSQNQMRVEMYEKTESQILYSSYEKIDETIDLKQLGLSISLKDIYESVQF